MKEKRKKHIKKTIKDDIASVMKSRKTKPAGDKQKKKCVPPRKDSKNKKRKLCSREIDSSSSPPRKKYVKENKSSR